MDFKLLRKAGITQQEMALIVGLSDVTIWKYVSGRTAPRNENARRVGVFLDILKVLVEKGQLPKRGLQVVPRMSEDARTKRTALITKLADIHRQKLGALSTNT